MEEVTAKQFMELKREHEYLQRKYMELVNASARFSEAVKTFVDAALKDKEGREQAFTIGRLKNVQMAMQGVNSNMSRLKAYKVIVTKVESTK